MYENTPGRRYVPSRHKGIRVGIMTLGALVAHDCLKLGQQNSTLVDPYLVVILANFSGTI